MVWARLLAHATGAINRELLLKNEYLVAENRILKTGEGAVGPFRRRKSYARGARSSARPQGFAGSGRDGTTRYRSGLVSETHRPEVRWVEVPAASRPTEDPSGDRESGGAHGERESRLGAMIAS